MKITCLLLFSAIVFHAQAQPALIEVAAFGKNQPIGCKVSRSGRLFVGFPRREPFLYALTEIKDGKRIPYPDAAFQNRFNNVQDLWTDELDHLWVLDSAPGKFQLLQFDLSGNTLKRAYTFDDLDKTKSALNDVRVDHLHGLAYLSDPGLSAVVILDLKSGKTRLALQNDPATRADPAFKLHLDGEDVVDDNGKPFSSNINGIALSADNQCFYFRAINQTWLYRIPTSALVSGNTTGKVEKVAETGVCHGMTADAKGNVYLSDSPNQAITYVSLDGKLHTLVKDARISWPDSMGVGPDGYLYFSASQLNRLPKYHRGQDKTDYPYRIYKVKLP